MADRMLSQRLHLAEGQGLAVGQEHRIIAETLAAAGRPYELAMHFAFEYMRFPVRPCKAECRGEVGAPLRRLSRILRGQLTLDAGHGRLEVLVRSGPASGIDARRTSQGLDLKP